MLVADGRGGREIQSYELQVKDPSREGLLELRPVLDERGRQAFVVSYWNPNLNMNRGSVERLQASLGSYAHPAGVPVVLEESGRDHGYFAAYISADDVARVVGRAQAAAANSGVSVSSADLNTLSLL